MGIEFGPSLKTVARRISAGIAMVMFAGVAGCASGPQPGPTAIPLRPTEAADFEVAEAESIMTQMMDAGAPAVFVEIRDGEHVWSDVQGVRSKKTELPAKITDPVRIASLTKPMVASILLQLVEEGRVQLGDRVEDYLPGIVDGRDVTVRQLLNHTSGLPDYVQTLTLEDPTAFATQIVTPTTNEELVERALALDWSFEPGAGWEYSNTNYTVITMLIEELTDSTLADQLRVRITEPLGLTATSLPSGTSMPEDAAHGYVVQAALSIDVTEQDASLWSGAGGIVSTVSDVNTFMRALLTGQVIAPELLGQMLTLVPEGYGLGVQSRTDQCPAGEPVYLEGSGADSDSTSSDTANSDATGASAADEPAAADSASSTDADSAGSDSPDAASASDSADTAGSDSDAASGSAESETSDASNSAETSAEGADSDTDSEQPSTPEPRPTYDFAAPESGSGSLHDSEFGELVQIGVPKHVYGHIGSGLGYRGLTMSSPDGMRQVTILWTVSPTDYSADPRLDLAYSLADVALSINC